MPPRKAPAKKAVAKPSPAKKPIAKNVASKPPKKASKTAPPARPKKATAQEAPAKKPATRRPPGSPPIQKTRVVIAMDAYEPNKDAIKAPFKAQELKWNFLGEGKGLYKRPDNGVHCFVQFKDDGVHYSIWGDDKKAVGEVLTAWRLLLGEAGWTKATASGEQAAVAEQQEKESEAVKLWRLGEPQRRPGEPDLFFQKRVVEWQAKRPA